VDGQMTWSQALTWASDLTYGGYDDWRLPSALNLDGSGPCAGLNCTGSEFGHLYSAEFGNPGNAGLQLINFDGLFSIYWTSTEASPTEAWAFSFASLGKQGTLEKDPWCSSCLPVLGNVYAWAVRDGDSAQVPEPSPWLLLGAGLVCLALGRKIGAAEPR
jgi:hypothetical protein